MALVNWVYGANWTDKKDNNKKYIVKNGILQDNLSFVLSASTTQGYADGARYISSSVNGDKGGYINYDFTDYSKLKFIAKQNSSGTARVGYADEDSLTHNWVNSDVITSEYAEYTIDISAINTIKALHLIVYVRDSTLITIYATNIWLEK